MTKQMNPVTILQNQFGWDEWFTLKAKEMSLNELSFARVVTVDRDQLLVINNTGEFRAKMSGRFLHITQQQSDYPTVGDWVAVQYACPICLEFHDMSYLEKRRKDKEFGRFKQVAKKDLGAFKNKKFK